VNGSSNLQYLHDLKSQSEFWGNKGFDLVNNFLGYKQGHTIELRENIGTQVGSESQYISKSRNYAHPNNLQYFRSYAEVGLDIKYKLFSLEFTKTLNMGDGVVLPKDTTLPIRFTSSTVVDKKFSTYAIVNEGGVELSFTAEGLQDYTHDNFIVSAPNIINLIQFLQYEEN
jgi:hypothetical protein